MEKTWCYLFKLLLLMTQDGKIHKSKNSVSLDCRFRSIARSYFRKAHGVLLLYDVTSESSFLNVREWVDQIQVTVEMLHEK